LGWLHPNTSDSATLVGTTDLVSKQPRENVGIARKLTSIALGSYQSEHNEGAQCPGRRKVPTVSQVLFSMQYIYSQKTLGSNMGAPNLFLAPGAI